MNKLSNYDYGVSELSRDRTRVSFRVRLSREFSRLPQMESSLADLSGDERGPDLLSAPDLAQRPAVHENQFKMAANLIGARLRSRKFVFHLFALNFICL